MRETVLVIDDDAGVLRAFEGALDRFGYDVRVAASAAAGQRIAQEQPIDAIMLDLELPDANGLDVLKAFRATHPTCPIVMISGRGTINVAVDALQLGAIDFLPKPVLPEKLGITLRNALRISRLEHEVAELRDSEKVELVGRSPAIQHVIQLISRVAPTDGRVLITGENGTGKELIAAEIHRQSQRREQSMVALNCAAVPENLIESELFGHVKGAFTGADTARKGRFELANGGTLFLDEIGEMPLGMQAKLLRVLQESRFERVGSSETIQVDVRVVAATNQDLQSLIAAGRFRQDLYYRLNVVEIVSPPLRHRREDIPLLAHCFFERAKSRHGRGSLELSEGAVRVLCGMEFPGNVRELQNLVERLVILSSEPNVGELDAQRLLATDRPSEQVAQVFMPAKSFKELVEDAQRAILKQAFSHYGPRVSDVANGLGMERSHLYKKCRALRIEFSDPRVPAPSVQN